jgi:hypothetical protein
VFDEQLFVICTFAPIFGQAVTRREKGWRAVAPTKLVAREGC